ncbi:MAG: hypothetical protein N2376_07350 [Clostridia bacterium]|nr:hypothetical protein [Clostridia bacterium]
MEDKKMDRHVPQEYRGDPAFYNDQIGHDQEPAKVLMDRARERKTAGKDNSSK